MAETDPAPGAAAGPPRRWRGYARVLASALLPLLLLGSWTVAGQPEPERRVTQPPRASDLARAERGCPPPGEDGARVLVGSARDRARGAVTLDPGGQVRLPRGGVVGAPAPDRGTVVRGVRDTAPGLVAGLVPGGEVAAVSCAEPRPDQWFAGLGARPGAAGTLHLVNPDDGRAVAEVTLLGSSGEREVEELRAVTVPGGSTQSLELARLAPTRQDLVARVRVTRGRLAVSAAVTVDELGAGARSTDGVPRSTPGPTATLLGVPRGGGSRVVTVANPGEDELRVSAEAVRGDSVVTPQGAEPLRVPPGAARSAPLRALLGEQDPSGVDGVRLTAADGRDFVAGVRSLVGRDVAASPALPALRRGVVLLPRGGARLHLLGAGERTPVRVRASDARGREVLSRRVAVSQDRAGRLRLPDDARRVTVRAADAEVRAAVALRDPQGTAVLPVRLPALDNLLPAVRPAR